MRERRRSAQLVGLGLLLLLLACGPCNLLSRDLPTPPPRVGVTPEAAEQLRARLEHTLSAPPDQQFILRLTDAELTSYLAVELGRHGESPIANPTVWFTKGKIHATGRLVNVVPFSASFFLVAAPRIQDGRVVIDIEQISAGSLPIPRRALEVLSQSINQTVDEAQFDVRVTALEILEGEAIIQGYRR